MAKFHSTFYSLGSKHDFSVDAWSEFFTADSAANWEKDEGGSIQFINDDNERYSLIMNYKSGEGISMSYDRYSRADTTRNFSLISQSRDGLHSGFDYLENGATVPKGSCLTWDDAWNTVKEFLCAPETQPTAVTWVDADTLNWPEDY